jgi:CelD/BcsL family acetyltransferase involved in cellulose biosynthesis
MLGVQVLEVGTQGEVAALVKEWSEVMARSSQELPTVAPEFLLPWLEATLTNSGAKRRFLIARRGGRLVGLLPLVHRKIRRFGLTTNVLEFPMYGTTPPMDIVVDDSTELVMAAFCSHLRRAGGWDVLWLHQVPTDSPGGVALPAAARAAGLTCRVGEAGSLLYAPLSASWDEFEKALGKNQRRNLRRFWRHLEEKGKPRSATYPTDIATLDQALAMATSVIDRSWKNPGSARKIQHRLLSELSQSWATRGDLIMRFLLMDDVPIAYLLEITYGSRTYAISNAYDLAFLQYGTGHHVLREAIRGAHAAKKTHYEFLGDKDYLERWSDKRRNFNTYCLVAPSVASRIKAELYLWARMRQMAAAKAKAERTKERRKSAGAAPHSQVPMPSEAGTLRG